MLNIEDIKKLTKYQVEVFKDVFVTKDDFRKTDVKIDEIQISLDVVLNDKKTRDQEVAVLNYRMKKTEDFLDKAAPKLGLKFGH